MSTPTTSPLSISSSISSTTQPPPPAIPSSPATPPPSTSTLSQALSNIGFGYSIAIALGFLVLLSSLLLSSYLCFRRNRTHSHTHHRATPPPPLPLTTTSTTSIILPRIIFVAEDDDDNHNNNNNNNPTGVVGLPDAVINSYPKSQYRKSSNGNDNNNCCSSSGDDSDTATSCSICLCEYKEGEMLRIMPDCNHFFHLLCLDAWLRLNGSCPVCRNSPLPTPLSTPLAEVVPLAQYPDNRRRRSS